MAATFHPTEEGNFKPLREKADSLYLASKMWMGSKVPADFKEKETTENLAKLNRQCSDILAAVKANASDDKLKTMITEAHDTFHKIAAECRKGDHDHDH
jgi:hypothetical protein